MSNTVTREALAAQLIRLADILRDCGRLVSKSGEAEKIMRDAAATLATQPARPSTELLSLRAEAEALRNALQDVREALHLENEKLRGPICDTIWMPHGAETLFDFLDAAIAATKGTT